MGGASLFFFHRFPISAWSTFFRECIPSEPESPGSICNDKEHERAEESEDEVERKAGEEEVHQDGGKSGEEATDGEEESNNAEDGEEETTVEKKQKMVRRKATM